MAINCIIVVTSYNPCVKSVLDAFYGVNNAMFYNLYQKVILYDITGSKSEKKLKPLTGAAFHMFFLESATDNLHLYFVWPYCFYFLWSRLVLDSFLFFLTRVQLVLTLVELVLICVDLCWFVLIRVDLCILIDLIEIIEVQSLVISFWLYKGKVMRMMTVILKYCFILRQLL